MTKGDRILLLVLVLMGLAFIAFVNATSPSWEQGGFQRLTIEG